MQAHTVQRDVLLRGISERSVLKDIRIAAGQATGIDFSGMTLINVCFVKDEVAALANCTFEGATLKTCSFEDLRLSNCSFRNAMIESSSFGRSELLACNFDGSILCESYFPYARLAKSRFREATLEWTDLRYAEVDGVTFQDATMTGCDFYRADIKGVSVFDDAKIVDASLLKAAFQGAIIRKDNLYFGVIQEYEDKYREFREHWAASSGSTKLLSSAGRGILQENQSNLKFYHKRWAGIRKGLDETYPLSDRTISYLTFTRYGEAIQVYRSLHAAWTSSGFLRDAAWAYVKLKRLETRTYLPRYAWVMHGRGVPTSLTRKQHRRALSEIGEETDRALFDRCYAWNESRTLFGLRSDLGQQDVVGLREIYVSHRLRPMYSWRNRFGKVPNLIGNTTVDLVCGYGESLGRILWSMFALALLPALFTFALDTLKAPDGNSLGWSEHLLFSIRNLTLNDPGDVVVGDVTRLIMQLQSIVGIALVGLFGFVLGNVIRNR